jgi:hypothetical protein
MEIIGFNDRDYDDGAAFEKGCLFEYNLGKDGAINIRSLMIGDENPLYRRKFAELVVTVVKPDLSKLEKAEALKAEAAWDRQANSEHCGLVYDYCVLEWDTTIKSLDGEIEPNRGNFISLMSGKKTSHLFDRLLRDASTKKSFQLSEDALGNLLTPLDGS